MNEFVEIDYVSNTQIQEKITVKYEAIYNDEDNSVLLTATIDNNGEIFKDTVSGIAFIDSKGNPDALLDFDGEYIFLSELNDITVIENCGWFKKLVSAAIATVVVTVVASVLATGGASLGAVVGVCAFIGAGVGGTTSAIVCAIDDEVSFQEVAANFGAGLVVGAAVGAVT